MIKNYMSNIFANFKLLQDNNELKNFWDVVVITVFDEDQRANIEAQMEVLLKKYKILKERVHVVADPINKKIGCGGSTLHVLQYLLHLHGSSLYEKKILIIHSGGYSKRLPNYSVQGKIFAPMPIKELLSGSEVTYMLELKLAMYLPFCEIFRPGVFVACSDDIETYFMDHNSIDSSKLGSADVIALAHPCDLETAVGHGVYVLPEDPKKDRPVVVSDCLEVLQKPTVELMREKGAVYNSDDGKEYTYSDSVFWMGPKAYTPLLNWFKNAKLDSELDAYGDILTCLGTKTSSKTTEDMKGFKSELFPILKELKLTVIVLNESRFYHIGTMQEFLDNFTANESFLSELNLCQNTSNLSQSLDKSTDSFQNLMIAHSYIKDENIVSKNETSKLIIEWSTVEIPIIVENNLILSNCTLNKCPELDIVGENVTFYGNFLYYTVPILHESSSLFVTVVFDINSNLKQCYDDISSLNFASVPLTTVIRECGLSRQEVLKNGAPYSLWTVNLFPGLKTPTESFWRSFYLVNKILNWRDGIKFQVSLKGNANLKLFSMNDVLKFKDLNVILKSRKELMEKINNTFQVIA